eukprot:7548969-Pyramimonas_sp.AAC.1
MNWKIRGGDFTIRGGDFTLRGGLGYPMGDTCQGVTKQQGVTIEVSTFAGCLRVANSTAARLELLY